ncbi:MAG: hypothetical protein K8F91_01155, partial [Candidatus Obscuribacterales bacterium]|nr:hypothetical protein [Candidatus Obscuribacterales bacterium]
DDILALDGRGGVEIFAGYNQFEKNIDRYLKEQSKSGAEKKTKSEKPRRQKKAGLTFPEKRDLESMPALIEKTEAALAALQEKMSQPEIAADFVKLDALLNEQKLIEKELENLYERWQALEAKASEAS